jgi:hypothetical protein
LQRDTQTEFCFFINQVTLLGSIERQIEFCKAMFPDFRTKSKKRKLGETPTEEMFEVSRSDSGMGNRD